MRLQPSLPLRPLRYSTIIICRLNIANHPSASFKPPRLHDNIRRTRVRPVEKGQQYYTVKLSGSKAIDGYIRQYCLTRGRNDEYIRRGF